MQDLENNNWEFIKNKSPLGIIYEICANLIVMTSKFHVCYHYFRYLWKSSGEKTLLTLSVPNILK